jgi:hypothetical protein
MKTEQTGTVAGFTPGPWTADNMLVQSTDHNPRTVATTAGFRGITRDLANARLIAASPCLLDACEQVLLASEDNGDMEDIDWKGLRAAVAKAKGQP